MADVSFHPLPISASTEKELEEWARKQHGYAQTQHLEVRGHRLFAVFVYVGSGTPRPVADIYVRGPNGLSLVMVRYTDAESLSLTYDKVRDVVNLQSPSGKVYATLPVKSLGTSRP